MMLDRHCTTHHIEEEMCLWRNKFAIVPALRSEAEKYKGERGGSHGPTRDTRDRRRPSELENDRKL